MTKRRLFYLLFFTGIILFCILLLQPIQILLFREQISMLFPKGIIALEERNLLLIIQGLMLLVIIPVYILTFVFSWRYRSTNKKATYDPDLVDHKIAEAVWWGLPLLMTGIICFLTIVKTYELDPFKPLSSEKKTIKIQVVALQWKWLFLYPEEKIASVNFLQIPKDTPIHFEITADAPMNSFWIPDLGGQIYAMPNMKTNLYLMANEEGDFKGASANISGEGFSGMHFIVRTSSEDKYQEWVKTAQQSTNQLNYKAYQKIALPTQNNPVTHYHLEDTDLFNQILMKYMGP